MATTLQTTFAGLSLRNPIIVSSSGLTDSAAKNQKLCEAGAGAIVLKSLFHVTRSCRQTVCLHPPPQTR